MSSTNARATCATTSVVWSVGTPILIAEGIAGERRTAPWLKRAGLVATSLLFLAGCASSVAFSLKQSSFAASPAQFLVSAALIAAIIVLAFAAFKPTPDRREPVATSVAPRPLVVSLATLILASLYLASEPYARAHHMAPAVGVVFRLACEAEAIAFLAAWSTRQGWTARHYLAIAAGTTLTYFLFGLNVVMRGHTNLGVPTDAIDVAGQIVLGLGVLALIAWAARRTSSHDGPQSWQG